MTYRAITDGELSGAVVKESVGLAYRDNPQGIMDGDSGASQIAFEAISKAIYSTSGSTTGVQINLQPYSFFPCLYQEKSYGLSMQPANSDANDPDSPCFRWRLDSGLDLPTPYAYAVTCWYLTDPDDDHSWTSIADGAFDQDSPGKGTIFKQLRDNVYAWAENASGAPSPIASRDRYKTATYSTSGTVPAATSGGLIHGRVTISLLKGAFYPAVMDTSESPGFLNLCGGSSFPDDPDQPQFGIKNRASIPKQYAVAYRTWDDFVDKGNWTVITDSMLADGNDLTTGLAVAFRDNIDAVPRGADGAPRISVEHIQTETERFSSSTNTPADLGMMPFFPMIYSTYTGQSGYQLMTPFYGPLSADGPYFVLSGASGYGAWNVRRIAP